MSVYTLLKVVSYYDFSVLPMSVMGFQRNSLDGGWVGGFVDSIQVFLDFLNLFNFAKHLISHCCFNNYILFVLSLFITF